MQKVKKREFLLFPNKYLKESKEFIITNHGKPQYLVTIAAIAESKQTDETDNGQERLQ